MGCETSKHCSLGPIELSRARSEAGWLRGLSGYDLLLQPLLPHPYPDMQSLARAAVPGHRGT